MLGQCFQGSSNMLSQHLLLHGGIDAVRGSILRSVVVRDDVPLGEGYNGPNRGR